MIWLKYIQDHSFSANLLTLLNAELSEKWGIESRESLGSGTNIPILLESFTLVQFKFFILIPPAGEESTEDHQGTSTRVHNALIKSVV